MDAVNLVLSIDGHYLSEDFELAKVANNLDARPTSSSIIKHRSQLESVLEVVSRKVSELVLNNQPVYVEEIKRIADLQKSISESIKVCSEGRKSFDILKNGVARNGLTVVQQYKKRESLFELQESLLIIKNLRKLILNDLPSLIKNEQDLPKAIEECNKVRDIVNKYDTFVCVEGLGQKLNDLVDYINEQIDSELLEMCKKFDMDIFNNLKKSYGMLGRSEIAFWIDLKQKIRIVMSNFDLSNYNFDKFIEILCTINHIMQIASQHRDENTLELQKDLNLQASNFFRAYHQSAIDELAIFLDQELWEQLPVRSNFKLMDLKEFFFLRNSSHQQRSANITEIENSLLENEQKRRILNSDSNVAEDLFDSDQQESFLKDIYEPLNIDKLSLIASEDEDDDLDDDDADLYKNSVDEDEFLSSDDETNCDNSKVPIQTNHITNYDKNNIKLIASGPVLTNSSLNVLRLIGRYIQVMNVLQPISYEILLKIYGLLDYYIITVFKKFGPQNERQIQASSNNLAKSDEKNLSPKLRSFIQSIKESLTTNSTRYPIQSQQVSSFSSLSGAMLSLTETNQVISSENINDISGLMTSESENSTSKYGLKNSDGNPQPVDIKKSVAIESLIVLVNQLWNLQEYMESLIPSDMRPRLREQFSFQTQTYVPDFLKAKAELVSSNNQ